MYSLNYVKHSKYASLFVGNRRDEMSRFVTDLSEDLEEECQADMLHDNIDISRLMVYVE